MYLPCINKETREYMTYICHALIKETPEYMTYICHALIKKLVNI